MKNTIFFAVSTIVLLLVSCSRQELEDVKGGIMEVCIAEPETRADFDSYEGKLTWTTGDKVAIHRANGKYVTREVTPSSTPYTGSVMNSMTEQIVRDYYAVYPASIADAANYGNPTLRVILPTTYDIRDIITGSGHTADYSPVPMVAVNNPTQQKLDFYHVGGLLRISCGTIPAGTERITVTLDKDVTGTYQVTYAEDPADHIQKPSITTQGTTTNTSIDFIVAASAGLGSATSGIVLNVPVPCGTYGTVTITAKRSNGTALLTESKTVSLVFGRHHGKRLSFNDVTSIYYNMAPISDVTVSGLDILRDAPRGVNVEVERDETNGYNGSHLNTSWMAYYSSTAPVIGDDVPAAGTSKYKTAPVASWLQVTNEGRGDGNRNPFNFTVAKTTDIGEIWDMDSDCRKMRIALQGNNLGTVDLSTRNFLTGATEAAETANCYIINGYGTFLIPLVYGNAIRNGSTNASAYSISGLSTTNPVFSSFVNADGNAITTPYILSDGNLSKATPYNAVAVWQEALHGFEMIRPENIEVLTSKPSGAALNCAYIRFKVEPEDIKPGNVVLALRDNNKKILWSWHLWFRTDLDNGSQKLRTIPVKYWWSATPESTPVGGYNYMLSENLGWTPPLTYKGGTSPEVSQYVAIVCVETRKVVGFFKVTRGQYTLDDYTGRAYSNTYYQWGRKDPFIPSGGGVDNTNRVTVSAEYSVVNGPQTIPMGTANGSSAAKIGWMIKNPYKMYQRTSTDVSSYPPENNLWDIDITEGIQVSNPSKTIYDPSPRGFVVPPVNAFNGITSDGQMHVEGETSNLLYAKWNNIGGNTINSTWPSGWSATTEASIDQSTWTNFFPCTSYRYATDAIVYDVGNAGYVWSAGPYNDNTGCAFGYNGSIRIYTFQYWTHDTNTPSYFREHAFSVRPIAQ